MNGTIQLGVARKRDEDIIVTLVIDGKTIQYRIAPSVAASLVGRLADALAA